MTFVFSIFDLLMLALLIFTYGKAMQASGRKYERGQNWEMDTCFALLNCIFIAIWFVLSVPNPNP